MRQGCFYTVTNCAEYTFFPGSQSLGEPAIAACSYILYWYFPFINTNVTVNIPGSTCVNMLPHNDTG